MNRSLKMIGAVLISVLFLFSTVTNIFAETAQEHESKSYVSGITSARARSLIGVALGLSSLIIGWRMRTHSKNKVNISKARPIVGGIFGLAAVVLSILHLTANTGGFGTGGGKAGAIVGLLVGVSGTVLSTLALRFTKVSDG